MGEVASSYVSIYPKFADGFGSDIKRQVQASTKGAFGPVEREASVSSQKLSKTFGETFRSVATPLIAVASIGAISSFVSKSVDAFAELEDSTAAAGVVFGDSMQTIIDQSNTAAQTIGISKQQVIDAANTFGTYGKSAGLAGKDLAGFASQMTTLAGDMASFRGTSPEQAIEAIGSALRGEMEPIRKFGVLLDDATLRSQAMKMGLIATTDEGLTPQVKVLAAQAAILAQTSDAQGDFARTSQSTANVQKTLAAESANLSAEIGRKLAPAITAAQKAGIGFLDFVNENMAVLAPLAGALGAVAAAIGGVVLAGKAMEAVKSARAVLSSIGDAAAGMSTKMKIAGASMGILTVALTVASIAYGIFAQAQADTEARITSYTQAVKLDSLAIGENTRAVAANNLSKSGALEAAQQLGFSLDLVTDAALGNKAAMDQILAVTGPMSSDFSNLSAEAQRQAIAADTLEKSLGLEADAYARGTTEAYRIAEATGVATTATTSATTATEKATTAQKEYLEEIAKTATAQLALSGSQIGLEAAIDGATAAVERNGKSLDIGTTKGRENRTALDQIATAGLGVVKSMEEAGRSSDDVKTAMDKSRTAFIKAATSMGMSKDKAKELADQLGLIKSKDIHVNVKWGTLPNALKVYTTAGGVKFQAAHGSKVPGFAAHDRDDKVPSLLTPDEWVIQRPSTRYYGDRVMSAINAARIPREVLQGYATGGRVGSSAPNSGAGMGYQSGDIAADIRAALDGARLELGRSDAFADTIEARIVTSIRRA